MTETPATQRWLFVISKPLAAIALRCAQSGSATTASLVGLVWRTIITVLGTDMNLAPLAKIRYVAFVEITITMNIYLIMSYVLMHSRALHVAHCELARRRACMYGGDCMIFIM